jgi:hypothetical protein
VIGRYRRTRRRLKGLGITCEVTRIPEGSMTCVSCDREPGFVLLRRLNPQPPPPGATRFPAVPLPICRACLLVALEVAEEVHAEERGALAPRSS